jgi:O-antigen/teichoic acid export membrane protein
MMGSSVMQIWIALMQTLMKIQQKPVLFTITNIIKLLLTLLLTIIFVVCMGIGIEGIYKAQIYGSLLFFLITAKYLYNNIEFKLDFRMIKEMLRFSFPLILASTSGILISILDKYILNYLATREDVGIYVFAYRMANSLKIFVIASVQMAVSPLLFQLMHDPGSKRFYSKYMTYFAFIVMICVIGLSAFSFEIVHLFAQNEIYYIAWSIIPILSFALFFGMLKDTASTGLQIAKETGIISIITISTTLINVGLNYISIPKFTYYGSAISFLLSQILFFILVYLFAQKKYPIPYEIKNILLIVVMGTILCLLTFVLNDLNLVLRLIIKASLVLSFPFLLYPFGFYEKIEITRLREAWLKWRNPMNWKRNLKKVNMDF